MRWNDTLGDAWPDAADPTAGGVGVRGLFGFTSYAVVKQDQTELLAFLLICIFVELQAYGAKARSKFKIYWKYTSTVRY